MRKNRVSHNLLIFLFCALLSSGAFTFLAGASATPNVPAEYQELYSFLDTTLRDFDSYLDSRGGGASYPVIFGAELLPANCNRGTALLNPQTMQNVLLFLDRLKELGVQGVTIPIGYPLYTTGFPRYQEYVEFYRQVAQEVRDRGMTLSVESSVIFANTEFSTLQVDYSGLTFDKFQAERREMIERIIQDTKPDFLNLGAEPDTQFQLLGFEEFKDPEKYAASIINVLNGLDRGSTKIGAGIGTWGNLDYVRALAADPTIDSIHIHVYPIYMDFLKKILTISEIAKQNGKLVVMDEAWLLKSDKPPMGIGSVAASPEHFRRDAFSFWASLDQTFLSVIAKSARLAQIDYISPFWTQLFFGYVDYSQSNAELPYKEMSAMVNQVAAANIVAGKFTSTGEAYRQLAAGATTITLRTSTSTLSEQEGEDSGDEPLLSFAGGVILVAVALVIIFFAVTWFRRLKPGLG